MSRSRWTRCGRWPASTSWRRGGWRPRSWGPACSLTVWVGNTDTGGGATHSTLFTVRQQNGQNKQEENWLCVWCGENEERLWDLVFNEIQTLLLWSNFCHKNLEACRRCRKRQNEQLPQKVDIDACKVSEKNTYSFWFLYYYIFEASLLGIWFLIASNNFEHLAPYFWYFVISFLQIWNDYCEAHEAYQFLRKKHSLKYGEFVPTPTYKK